MPIAEAIEFYRACSNSGLVFDFHSCRRKELGQTDMMGSDVDKNAQFSSKLVSNSPVWGIGNALTYAYSDLSTLQVWGCFHVQ